MGKEIERKFLVLDDSYRGLSEHCHEISQGYLSREAGRTVRVRTRDGKGFLTVKGKTRGCERLEYEYEIPYADARELLQLCPGRIVEKKRYCVRHAGKLWEIDEFLGELAPLVVAEVELEAPDEEVELPPFIGEEVTGDPRYYNSNL